MGRQRLGDRPVGRRGAAEPGLAQMAGGNAQRAGVRQRRRIGVVGDDDAGAGAQLLPGDGIEDRLHAAAAMGREESELQAAAHEAPVPLR